MATRTKAYVDSGAFIAFLDQSDSYHRLFSDLFASDTQPWTSSAVIIETHGWFLRRFDAARALQFLNFIDDLKPLKIIGIEAADIKQARGYLIRFKDQRLTLVDGLGLHLMDRYKISFCWSTDRHLGLTGRRLAIHR